MILVENVFSARQFPLHVIAANEEDPGFEAWRVADGRRSPLDAWTPTTFNQDAWLKATCDRPRAATMLAVDRGHNLVGETIKLQASDDDAGWRDVLNLLVPASSAPGTIDDALGVLTEEGAWLKRFDLDVAKYWRCFVPAMGTDQKPYLVGLWLGQALQLEYLDNPFEDDHDELLAPASQTVSDRGWRGATLPTRRRNGELRIKIRGATGYDQVRYHLQGHYGEGRPLWLVHDADQGDRAVLVRRPPGRQGFALGDGNWGWRSGTLAWEEHEARP